jgi:hypothetical protein
MAPFEGALNAGLRGFRVKLHSPCWEAFTILVENPYRGYEVVICMAEQRAAIRNCHDMVSVSEQHNRGVIRARPSRAEQ